ncbi:MAG: hypothetical protein FJ144_09105 [Deltaproteobacteria bacterium]|nr:hypothetical protein [Deltaproteobacteria bacterium]
MKRAFVLAFFAFLLWPAGARGVATEDFKVADAQDLVDVCSTPTSDPMYGPAMGFCHGYAVGAWQYYLGVGKKFVCPPDPTPPRQKILQDFLVWAKGHPQYMKENAAATLFKFLHETFPCKK